MIEVICVLATEVLLLLAFCVRPVTARCPDGWYADAGVRRSGEFSCRRNIEGDPLYDGAAGFPERGVQPPGELLSHVYCTGGSVPIIVNATTIGCSR